MFLRNIVRSLSFEGKLPHRKSKDRSAQSDHKPLRLHLPQSPSKRHLALPASPHTRLEDNHQTPVAPAQVDVPTPSQKGTDTASISHSLTSAAVEHGEKNTENSSSSSSSRNNNHNYNNNNNEDDSHDHDHDQTLTPQQTQRQASSSFTHTPASTRRTSSSTLDVAPATLVSDKIIVIDSDSTCDPGDQQCASNFPFRPPPLQTLSPTPDHHAGLNATDDQNLIAHVHLHPQSQPQPQTQTHTSTLHPSDNNYDPGIVMQRKVWVKRPGASATRVEVNEDDLVDNVRDVILRKYANSLGKHIDSPDITLKIVSREQANKNVALERVLGPEESIGRTLDTYYPGGQTIEEALLIEVPQKRTPRPSPRPGNHQIPYYIPEDYRPGDGAREYFPPMPLQSPHITHVQHPAGPPSLPVHSMSVLTTGQLPALPSPGGHSQRRHPRPKYGRQHTSSPTILHSSQTNGVDAKSQINGVPTQAQPLPTPPPTVADKSVIAPTNRTTSPHPSKTKKKKNVPAGREMNGEQPLPIKPASAGLIDGRVPPINVLLVEDNVINLKLLEQFMKRLKVRWKSAVNGREAVNLWRTGGFHLVLMDIQLPVMNGLEATKEIRRLESVNGIGLSVFGERSNGQGNSALAPEDKLGKRELFKSPVIIVALTASSLQSDRHEALAVGCNDFLTKPVNFGWMERKVTEWGCMQALIDFKGWRDWKELAAENPERKKQEEKEEKAKTKAALKAMFSRPPPSAKKDDNATKKEEASGAGLSNATSAVTSPPEQPPHVRRAHKSARGQSGSLVGTLGTTPEVDEKDS